MTSNSDESSLIAAILRDCNYRYSERFPTGPGDDAAVRVCREGEQLIFTADTLVEDVDFRLDWTTLDNIGERAVEVNLSDCAAMGAVPDSILVQIVFPKSADPLVDIPKLYEGIGRSCRRRGIPVIGGDLSKGPCWMIGISLTGRKSADESLRYRHGAQSGDKVWTTGLPGRSAAGLALLMKYGSRCAIPVSLQSLADAHLSPHARIEEGLKLSALDEVHSMIDISDGIAHEALCIAEASKRQLLIDIDNCRFSDDLMDFCESDTSRATDLLLYGGEDFELLFCAASDFDPVAHGISAMMIGEVGEEIMDAESIVSLRKKDGSTRPIEKKWFDHLMK